MSNRRIVSVAAVSTSGTAYTGRADGLFSTNDQAKLKQAGVWPTAIKAPSAPTAASATAGNLQAAVSFTTPSSLNGETITSYTVTSLPGSVTATGASSPITVSGLTGGTSYTFTVVANTASGASLSSASSSSITIVAITYSDEVFSTYLYTGNSSTQTIVNGIDLAGQGGMVWLKSRSSPNWRNCIFDTSRGVLKRLATNNTDAQEYIPYSLEQFNSNGFSLNSAWNENEPDKTYVSWTFRKAAKFFDIVTYTGNGVAGRQIAHSLGVAPGMITVKSLGAPVNGGADGFWFTYHRGLSSPGSGAVFLNSTDGRNGTGAWNNTLPTADVFTIDDGGLTNISGRQYVAYLFAHDTAADGIIQCGSVTSNASGVIPITNLGWEPQFMLLKNITSAWNWEIHDVLRGWSISTNGNAAAKALNPNLINAEGSGNTSFTMTPTGFYSNANFGVNQTYIYMVIRRPNKPPTSGTQVYNAIARTGTGAAATVTGVGFAPDLVLIKTRTYQDTGSWDSSHLFFDRLRGIGWRLGTAVDNAEDTTNSFISSMDMQGVSLPAINYTATNNAGTNYINHFFKRAPGFFDIVCYTGNSAAGTTQAHNLTVVPEMMIVKARSTTTDWYVYVASLGNTVRLLLNTTQTPATVNSWNNTTPSSTTFTLGGAGVGTNTSAVTYVAYLFATLAGISKVGSYTGNGSSQTINCGFTTGARFILIKRTDAVGDWYIWDTARGIIASANNPHLSLNTTATEVTTDNSIDPANSGFIAIQNAATNINVTSATYIFLAIA